jgi:hypothetical protein
MGDTVYFPRAQGHKAKNGEGRSVKEFQADVIVCGGGTAGLPAALAAARAGKSVIVADRGTRMGGSPVNYLIQCFCGRPFHGICRELILKMKENSEDYMYTFVPGNEYPPTFRSGDYILAWRQFFKGLPIRTFPNQEIRKAESADDGSILSVASDAARYIGKVYIDATGDANLARLTSCKVTMGREARGRYNEPFAPVTADKVVQRCTLMYILKRTRENVYGKIPNWAEYSKQEYLMWGPTVAVADPTDPLQLAEATEQAHALLLEENEKWREKGFVIVDVAPHIGVRETRRIIGNHVLNAREILDKVRFADSITTVRDAAIDPWEPEGNPFHDRDKAETCKTPAYEIPYASLVTDAVPNMIVAGRCISSTHIANSSHRVMPICIATGEAAGNAAAIACAQRKVNVTKIDVTALRKKLTENGVEVSIPAE